MAAAATTALVTEAAEKEVTAKVGWLKSSIPNARHEGGSLESDRSQQSRPAPNPRAHSRKHRTGTDEDVNTESLGYPCEIRPVCRISDSSPFTI